MKEKETITMTKRVDGKIAIKKKEHLLNSYLLPTRSQREIDVKLIAITRKKSDWKPPIGKEFPSRKERAL